MKYVLVALALAALCVPAFGAGNPNVNVYVSFDQTGAGGLVHEYTMTQYVGFNAYFCFGGLDMGIVVVTFMINNPMVEYPGLFASQSFTNGLDLMVGDPFTGMSLASTTCRPGPVEVVGYLNLFPIAVGPCCVNMLDDPAFPRWVVDCTLPNGEVDFYAFLSNGSINGADCPDTPVDASSWGSIKALYR